MSNKNTDPVEETASAVAIDIMTADLSTISREQLVARYEANVFRQKSLAYENEVLGSQEPVIKMSSPPKRGLQLKRRLRLSNQNLLLCRVTSPMSQPWITCDSIGHYFISISEAPRILSLTSSQKCL